MSNYNTKNYTEQGGEKTVIGGELVIEAGAELKVLSGATFTNENGSGEADAAKIPYMAASVQSTGANVAKDLSGLIALLKTAGLMDTTAPTLSITSQPQDVTCAVNGAVSLSVAAAVSDGRPIAYQWYSNASDSNTGGTKITAGGAGATYAPPTNAAGTVYYYCVVLDGSGAATESVASVASETAAVTVGG